MKKYLNPYYLGFCFLIVLIQLSIPPKIANTYSYLLFLSGVFLINGGYVFIRITISNYKKKSSKPYFTKSDFSLLVFLTNNIGVSTFLFFVYMFFVILGNAYSDSSGLRTEKYFYHGEPYFITADELFVLLFWEYSTLILIPFYLVITIFSGLNQKEKRLT